MDVKLDDRMSDETKQYVKGLIQISRPKDILKADLQLVRKFKDNASLALNKILKFDDLVLTEFFVRNKIDNHEIAVTKYEPKNLSDNTPITVFFHGGGYCLGSRQTHHHSVGLLASKTNSVWLSVEYRRCPDEGQYPVLYTDCKTVVEWAIENKSTLGSANTKLGLCGDSSGGQMAAIIAHELKSYISFQVLIYPVVSFSDKNNSLKEFNEECFILVPEVIEFFVKNLCKDPKEHAAHLSPILYSDFSNLPKCLLIAAELDPLVDDSRNYHAKLKEENIECTLTILKGIVHGYFSSPLMFKDAFRQTENIVAEFFKSI